MKNLINTEFKPGWLKKTLLDSEFSQFLSKVAKGFKELRAEINSNREMWVCEVGPFYEPSFGHKKKEQTELYASFVAGMQGPGNVRVVKYVPVDEQ